MVMLDAMFGILACPSGPYHFWLDFLDPFRYSFEPTGFSWFGIQEFELMHAGGKFAWGIANLPILREFWWSTFFGPGLVFYTLLAFGAYFFFRKRLLRQNDMDEKEVFRKAVCKTALFLFCFFVLCWYICTGYFRSTHLVACGGETVVSLR